MYNKYIMVMGAKRIMCCLTREQERGRIFFRLLFYQSIRINSVFRYTFTG